MMLDARRVFSQDRRMKLFKHRRITPGLNLHRAICQVTDMTTDRKASCEPRCCGPKAHTLYTAMKDPALTLGRHHVSRPKAEEFL